MKQLGRDKSPAANLVWTSAVSFAKGDRAFVFGYNMEDGKTYLQEFWISEDTTESLTATGKLENYVHWPMGLAARLPTGLSDFVSFVIGDRTFVDAVAVGNAVAGGNEMKRIYEIDFTNKEMNLVNERACPQGYTSAVAFASPNV